MPFVLAALITISYKNTSRNKLSTLNGVFSLELWIRFSVNFSRVCSISYNFFSQSRLLFFSSFHSFAFVFLSVFPVILLCHVLLVLFISIIFNFCFVSPCFPVKIDAAFISLCSVLVFLTLFFPTSLNDIVLSPFCQILSLPLFFLFLSSPVRFRFRFNIRLFSLYRFVSYPFIYTFSLVFMPCFVSVSL